MNQWIASMSSEDKLIVSIAFTLSVLSAIAMACNTIIRTQEMDLEKARIQQGVRSEQVQGGVGSGATPAPR